MENLSKALIMIRKNCYMISVDLADATNHKYLFSFKNKLYKFLCLPNGLTSAPGIFIKPLKSMFSHFRKLGHEIMGYLDDSFICGDSFNQCKVAATDTVELFHKLGFKVKFEKSELLPAPQIEYLGFIIDYREMKVN